MASVCVLANHIRRAAKPDWGKGSEGDQCTFMLMVMTLDVPILWVNGGLDRVRTENPSEHHPRLVTSVSMQLCSSVCICWFAYAHLPFFPFQPQQERMDNPQRTQSKDEHASESLVSGAPGSPSKLWHFPLGFYQEIKDNFLTLKSCSNYLILMKR